MTYKNLAVQQQIHYNIDLKSRTIEYIISVLVIILAQKYTYSRVFGHFLTIRVGVKKRKKRIFNKTHFQKYATLMLKKYNWERAVRG